MPTAPITSVPARPISVPAPNQPEWVVVVCTTCVALDGEVCLADGQLATIPRGGGLPPGDSFPFDRQSVEPDGFVLYAGPLECAAPPAPAPPTAGDVWDHVSLPLPEIEFNPATAGVVQLPTWFWLGNDAAGADLTVGPVGLNGYSVTVTVHPVAYRWDFGDGGTVLTNTSGEAGSASGASATHTYGHKGTFQVGVTVTWAGSYTFSGYNVVTTASLGPVDQAESLRTYVVQEIRSVIVGDGAQ